VGHLGTHAVSANLKPQKIRSNEPEILSDDEVLQFLKLLKHAPVKWKVLGKIMKKQFAGHSANNYSYNERPIKLNNQSS
jgi:hypothetical protein